MVKTETNINLNNLIKLRAHLGGKKSFLNTTFLSYCFVFRYGNSILNVKTLWKSLRFFFWFFSFLVSVRNKFIFFIDERFDKNPALNKFLDDWNKNSLINSKIEFILRKGWLNGLLTNPKAILHIIKNYKNKDFKISRKKKYIYSIFEKELSFNKQKSLDFKRVDFILSTHVQNEMMNEAKLKFIPIITLVHPTDVVKIEDLLFFIVANNKSVNFLLFFFKLLQQSINYGVEKEQKFYSLIFIKKLKQALISK